MLKTHSTNADILSIKALSLFHLERVDDAMTVIKVAVKYNIKNSSCKHGHAYFGLGWQIYGTVLRNKQNYEEAAKCFRNAIKLSNVYFKF